MRFFSVLLLGRNYLWKMWLEKMFPMKFVFEQIYNSELSTDLRSVFCNLALTLYIDHEPLNPIVVPNLCRVFRPRSMGTMDLKHSHTMMLNKETQLDEESFSELVDNILTMIKTEQTNIAANLKSLCKDVPEAKIDSLKIDNLLNNAILANIVKALKKMMTFDVLTILDKTDYYSQIVYHLIHILEFDKNHPVMSFALAKQRGKTTL